MQASVVNFVRATDPNPVTENTWPIYGFETGKKKVFDFGSPNPEDGAFTASVGDDLLDGERCNYWQSAPYWFPEPEEDKVQLVRQGTSNKDELRK
jgi:hypothetical protein